jgi:hypothetical protein
MFETRESRLRWWAISATVVIIVLASLPIEVLKHLSSILEPSSAFDYTMKAVCTGATLFIVLGFYLRMLFECGFTPDVDHRGAWLALLILAPPISALIYYWVTRSSHYKSRNTRSAS